MASKLDLAGLARVSAKERNSYQQGRSGSGTPMRSGPVKSAKGNPTMGGGINRATRGK